MVRQICGPTTKSVPRSVVHDVAVDQGNGHVIAVKTDGPRDSLLIAGHIFPVVLSDEVPESAGVILTELSEEALGLLLEKARQIFRPER